MSRAFIEINFWGGGIISTDDFPGKAFSVDVREWLFLSTRERPFQSTFGSDFFDRRFFSRNDFFGRRFLHFTGMIFSVDDFLRE